MAAGASFREVQNFPRRRTAILLALPPVAMLTLLVWQIVLGHTWGKDPMSNTSVIGWTVFLWLLYFRLLTVRLLTRISDGVLAVGMTVLPLRRRIPLSDVRAVETVTFDARRDYGGYGIRPIQGGKAYIAAGNRGVRIKLSGGEVVVIGSARPYELAKAIRAASGVVNE